MDLSTITIPQILALVVATIGTITDLRTTKIPNVLTFPAAAVGIITQAVYFAMQRPDAPMEGALAGAFNGILGWIVPVAIMCTLKIYMKQMGHGDTKLLGAIGSFIGPAPVLVAFAYFSISFGIYSWFQLLRAVPWKQLGVAYSVKSHQGLDLNEFNKVRKQPLPIGPFIAIGTLMSVLFYVPTMTMLGMGEMARENPAHPRQTQQQPQQPQP